uniref:Mitochondrial 2-oxoglutarate/malate carrier protein n=1 Tax=Ditylenchus dipsaci TaxID=166011 RepID=A0A915D7R9_9BILA
MSSMPVDLNAKAVQRKPPTVPSAVKFLFGGLAGMGATLFVQPLDLVKNRMQLSGVGGKKEYNSSFHCMRSIIAKEGFFSIYNGYRPGVYTWLSDKVSGENQNPSFVLKLGLGITAGGVGAFVGNPTEVALIRMTSDGRQPVELRRNYKHVFNAISRIFKEEGALALWTGCTPTVARAMVVNAAQLATYFQAKQTLVSNKYFQLQDGIFCHFCASMISGLATTIASMPVDIVKTRIQNMRIINGKPEYTGVADVLRRVIANEGFFSLWKGFTPYYMRLGPTLCLLSLSWSK